MTILTGAILILSGFSLLLGFLLGVSFVAWFGVYARVQLQKGR